MTDKGKPDSSGSTPRTGSDRSSKRQSTHLAIRNDPRSRVAIKIARAMPYNPRLQAIGMKLVRDGKSINIAINTMMALTTMSPTRTKIEKRETTHVEIATFLRDLARKLLDWECSEDFVFKDIDYAHADTLDADVLFLLSGVRFTFPKPADLTTKQTFCAEVELYQEQHRRRPTHEELWRKRREEALTPNLTRAILDSLPRIVPLSSRTNPQSSAATRIARAAPYNPSLQALGMRLVQEGKPIVVAINAMRAARTMMPGQTWGDLFNFDDSTIREDIKISAVARAKQREIREDLDMLMGFMKNPALGSTAGIVVNQEALAKAIVELKVENQAWIKWQTDPSLVHAIRQELGLAPKTVCHEGVDLPINEVNVEMDSLDTSAKSTDRAEKVMSNRRTPALPPEVYFERAAKKMEQLLAAGAKTYSLPHPLDNAGSRAFHKALLKHKKPQPPSG